jgi:hypothetical protein
VLLNIELYDHCVLTGRFLILNRVEVEMVLAKLILSQNLLEGKILALCIYLETFGLHNKLGCLTDDSPDLCVHEEDIVHDWRLVG